MPGSDGFFLGTLLSRDGVVVGCDPGLAQGLGYAPGDLPGRPVTDLLPERLHADARKRCRQDDESRCETELLTATGESLAALAVPRNLVVDGARLRVTALFERAPIAGPASSLTPPPAPAPNGAGEGRPLAGLGDVIAVLANTTAVRDPYTHRHQTRVGGIAVLLGRELGFSDEECRLLDLGGRLHDIGKFAIPIEIMVKPTTLNTWEWELLKTHPVVGAEILDEIGVPPPVKEMVRSHHERMDGTGYPDGLGGAEIAPAVRVVSAADALDAISSVRPYHDRRSLAEAIDIIAGPAAGYDPEVVRAARSLAQRDAFAELA